MGHLPKDGKNPKWKLGIRVIGQGGPATRYLSFQKKIPPNEFMTLILKDRGPRRSGGAI